MIRKPLRVKSGCFTCRQRRKKCDESQPKCRGCSRLNLPCEWPETSHQNFRLPITSVHANQTSELLRMQSALHPIASGFQYTRCEYEPRLLSAAIGAINNFTSPISSSVYLNLSRISYIATRETWVQGSLAAFGAVAAGLQQKELSYCLTLYNVAVGHIQIMLNQYQLTQENIEAMVVSIAFLGMLEGFCFGNSYNTINHFRGILQLLRRFRIDSELQQDYPRLVCFRILIECSVYNISIHALFFNNLECLPRSLEDQSFERFFESHILSKSPFESSPFLAGQREIYYLIYELTWLGKSLTYKSKANSYTAQISDIETRIQVVDRKINEQYVNILNSELRHDYINLSKLLIGALWIFLNKIKNTNLCSGSPTIRNQIRQDEIIFGALQPGFFTWPNLCTALYWPLVIHMCAAEYQPTNTLLQDIAVMISKNLPCGQKRLLLRNQQKINTFCINTATDCKRKWASSFDNLLQEGDTLHDDYGCGAQHDALGLLITPGGFE